MEKKIKFEMSISELKSFHKQIKKKNNIAKTKTNSLTKDVIDYLNTHGFVVWRNNNGAVYSVKKKSFLKNPNHKLGVPDVIGFQKRTGRSIWVEIKTGKDVVSSVQYQFMEVAVSNNCLCIVAHNLDDVISFMEINALRM